MKNPFIFKKSNGFYYLCYQDQYTNKRRTLTTKHKSKASAKSFLLEYVRRSKPVTNIIPITLSEFKKIFLQQSANKKITTNRNYLYTINSFIKYTGDKKLSEYSLYDFDKYLTYKLSTRTPETAHLHRRSLKVVFDRAMSWNYLAINPVLRSVKIRLKENNIKYFAKEEFAKLIESTDQEYFKDLFYFAVLTGMRLNEILNCRKEDIDLEKKLIRVYGRKTDRTRFVELHESLISVASGDLFGKRSVDYISKRTKYYIRKAGINPALNFKAFRSTFGKWLLDEGVNLKYISQQLGHSSVITTEKHYSRYIQTEYKGWVDKIRI